MKRTNALRRHVVALVVAGMGLTYAVTAVSADPVTDQLPPGTYVGGGTAVVKEGGQRPAADEGSVTCDVDTGSGAGGACVPFGAGDAVLVKDAVAGRAVAFQVCVDNDGDSVCTFPAARKPGVPSGCGDEVFFSHDDAGKFFNPLGPLPKGFQPGCPGGPWRGYVVFLCEGVHDAGAAHAHAATTGQASLTSGGIGFGDFCGGVVENPTRKPYFLTGGGTGPGNYVSGGTVVAKQAGQPATVDSGALACDAADGSGIGGACVPFGAGDSVLVSDTAAGTAVAFQVCLDNNGDGVCTSPDFSGPCSDDIFFSHDDSGKFFNPLGPLPTGFRPGCPGGPWPGYVVFLCEGGHTSADGSSTGGSAHVHPASTGTASLTVDGTGYGTFCGGARQNPSRKFYLVV